MTADERLEAESESDFERQSEGEGVGVRDGGQDRGACFANCLWKLGLKKDISLRETPEAGTEMAMAAGIE